MRLSLEILKLINQYINPSVDKYWFIDFHYTNGDTNHKNETNSDCYCEKSFGICVVCNITINENCNLHTNEEIATLLDVLYCQSEQILLKQNVDYFTFDNEDILFTIINKDDRQTTEKCCLLVIDILLDKAQLLRNECCIQNRIHVSLNIYEYLKHNTEFYEFHSVWNNKKIKNSTYFLFTTNIYEQLTTLLPLTNTMIDQLARIQAQYHVEKHLD
ncbi:unnamed protein product [Didymodactylos carnosus]|uniref:Uncharacterized protein n=1 Tax=Didymodactylos carnosus TaxID=1234261 RepID=A0A814UGI6_9BILA|nr:unnamed protein product [Didymodactylos carnosus]CAF3935883.1 unnamed protein product [Didymodactylos carnosus]